jgi:hypothetical protein
MLLVLAIELPRLVPHASPAPLPAVTQKVLREPFPLISTFPRDCVEGWDDCERRRLGGSIQDIVCWLGLFVVGLRMMPHDAADCMRSCVCATVCAFESGE